MLVNGVASPSIPSKLAVLLIKHSIKCPIVIREGIACGLMMMSGTIPSYEKGISSYVYVIPTVPFCPCRDANLSPTCGIRIDRTRILTNLCRSALVVRST